MTSAQNQSDLESFLQCLDQWPVYSGYKELDKTRKEIRVLKIWFPPGTQDLHGSLEHVSLESSPSFEALSYYWGPPDEQRPIMIDGQVLMIRKNLHTFLAMLCTFGQDLPVWVDSLCIHQADVEERNHQVAMMGDIYEKAALVQAWIGDSDTDSNFALDYVGFLQTGALSTDTQHPQKFRDRLRQTFRVVAARPYWERMWIVQELVLAWDLLVVSGSRRVRWDCFITAMNHVLDFRTGSKIPNPMRDYSAGLNAYRIKNLDIIRSSSRSQSLFQLATKFADQLCTDPRDKIYALLGIANRDHGPYVPVDYDRAPLEICFDVLLSAVSKILLSSGKTGWSLNRALEKLNKDALRIIRSLPISSSDLKSDFFQGSVRIPLHNLRCALHFEHRAGSQHSPSIAPLFIPKEENASLQEGDLDFQLSPVHSVVVRADSFRRQYEIVGILDRGDEFLDPRRKKQHSQGNHLYYVTEICEIPERTEDGRIGTIYAHINRAILLIQILEDNEFRHLFDIESSLPNASSKSRLCACKTSNVDTGAEIPHETKLGWLNNRTRELHVRWFEGYRPPNPRFDTFDVSQIVTAFKLDRAYVTPVSRAKGPALGGVDDYARDLKIHPPNLHRRRQGRIGTALRRDEPTRTTVTHPNAYQTCIKSNILSCPPHDRDKT